MNTYNVTIKAEVYKTIMVEAADENEAYVTAHELFTVSPDGFSQKNTTRKRSALN